MALAALLIGDWDLLILDEPTNHLDVDGISWLAKHIKNRWSKNSGALLLVTHDRWFLDEVCTKTWEVHDQIVEPFEGGYAAYILQRVERDRINAATEQKRQNLMRKELAWLRRGAPARTSKPKFRIEAANQLIADVPEVRNPIELKKMATARLGKDVVDLLDVSLSFGDQQILDNVTWRIGPGERTGILGPNGAGKSTLLSLISGDARTGRGQSQARKDREGRRPRSAVQGTRRHRSDRRCAKSSRSRRRASTSKARTSLRHSCWSASASPRNTSRPGSRNSPDGQKRRLQLSAPPHVRAQCHHPR